MIEAIEKDRVFDEVVAANCAISVFVYLFREQVIDVDSEKPNPEIAVHVLTSEVVA